MATRIGIGFSQDLNISLAFKEAAIMAKHQINVPESDLVIVCSTDNYLLNQDALTALQKILQPKRSIYFLTTGLLLPHGAEEQGVGILAISSDEVYFGTSIKDRLSLLPPHEAGLYLSREAVSSLNTIKRQGLISFFSGHLRNHLFVRGLQEGFGRSLPIIGALSAGALHKKKSLVGLNDTTYEDAVIGLLISGQIPLATATRHGWQPLGRPRLITDARDNIIHTIDGGPAIDLYRNYFPENTASPAENKIETMALLYPLGISTDHPRQYLIRHITDIIPDGSIACQGDVSAGRKIYLMISDKDACRQATHDAAMEIREKLNGRPPKLILVFESLARRKILGRAATHQVALIKEILGLASPVFGMYTYGEIGPMAGAETHLIDTQIQNASITIAAIG